MHVWKMAHLRLYKSKECTDVYPKNAYAFWKISLAHLATAGGRWQLVPLPTNDCIYIFYYKYINIYKGPQSMLPKDADWKPW